MKNDQVKKASVDMKYFREAVGSDEKFKRDVFTIFRSNVDRNIRKMERAIEHGVNTVTNISWNMAAHSFKGSASSIGMFKLAEILEYAQKHPEETVEQKTEILNKVKEEVALILEFINQELLGE